MNTPNLQALIADRFGRTVEAQAGDLSGASPAERARKLRDLAREAQPRPSGEKVVIMSQSLKIHHKTVQS